MFSKSQAYKWLRQHQENKTKTKMLNILCFFFFVFLCFIGWFWALVVMVIEKSCILFISSFCRWQTNRLEHRASSPSSSKHAFLLSFLVLFWFHFALVFWAFRCRRVQCQKCQAGVYLFWFFLFIFSTYLIRFFSFRWIPHFWHATCTSLKPKLLAIFSGHLYWLCPMCVYPANDFIVSWRAYVCLNCFIWVLLCAGTWARRQRRVFFTLFFFLVLSAYAGSIRLWSLWCHAKANSSSFLFLCLMCGSGHIWTVLFYFSYVTRLCG